MTQILLVEDDKMLRTAIRKGLDRDDLELHEASNGAEGLQLFREKPTDIVITDIFMPEKSGVAVISELREEFPDVKIIAMSGAHGGTCKLSSVLMIGADRYLQKPFQISELLVLIDELIVEIDC